MILQYFREKPPDVGGFLLVFLTVVAFKDFLKIAYWKMLQFLDRS